jgi:hypothetical protein
VATGCSAAEAFDTDKLRSYEVPARKYVKQTMVIPGGHFPDPYIVAMPDTEYLLTDDVVADGTAIAVRAARVVLNLNGKTITYNQLKPGEGVTIDKYGSHDVAIINGTIIQGAAQSEGDVHGIGNNPVKSLGVSRLQVAGVTARYGGRDLNGFYLKYVDNGIIENCILEDIWNLGTMKNRHQGKNAIGIGDGAIIRNNTIVNARQGGIGTGNNSEIYKNTISINSMVTNSAGIGGYKAKNIKVHHNTIVGKGEHPLGIAYVSESTDNIEIYNNTIDIQVTRLGTEYGGNPACLNPKTPCGNYAVGFRTTWGGNNINFHDNTIVVHTDSAYNGTHSVTGKPVVIHAKGRGLMVAVNAGEKAKFYNNTITVLDKDGSGKAFGIACTGNNAGEMVFEGNRVTSNILNVALGDEYGACGGYPLFVRNTFVKSGNYPGYRTIASELGGYFEGTGRFVANQYESGAAQERIVLNAAGKAGKSVLFGSEFVAELSWSDGSPIADAVVRVDYGSPLPDAPVKTDEQGKVRLVVYEYELHNRGSKVEQKRQVDAGLVHVVGGDRILTGRLELGGGRVRSYTVPLFAKSTGEPAGTLKLLHTREKVLK